MAARTSRYVREIAATHSPWMIDVVTGGFRRLITKAYVELDYDHEELEALYRMGQRYPLVFLPTHKSHFDHQSLQFALYENGLPPNHTAGGINMNFFPVGPLIRRSGVFFIRREFKDNEAYKFVLRRYIDYLLQRRFPLEWYIEGARSRTGKLLPPKLGMLAYVVEGYQRGNADDVIFIPVAIAYDQIQDVQSYAAEQSGAPKRPETFAWMVRVIRGLQRRYGSIHLRLGRPISLRTFLADLGAEPADAEDTRSPAVPKLAFEIANRINEVMPITPISLVTLVMLGDDRPLLDFGEIHDLVRPVRRRGGRSWPAEHDHRAARRPRRRRLRHRRARGARHREPPGRRRGDPLRDRPGVSSWPPPTTATWSSTSSSTGRSPSWPWRASMAPKASRSMRCSPRRGGSAGCSSSSSSSPDATNTTL